MASETIRVERFTVGELYSRDEMAIAGEVTRPTSPRDPHWSSGIVRFANATLLLVTLVKKGESDFQYVDYFDGSLFWWQSQNQQTQSSPAIVALATGAVDAHLFARVHEKVSSKTQRFVYCGKLSLPELEGEKPVTALFELLDYTAGAAGALADVYGWKPDGKGIAPAETVRQKAIVTRRATGQGRMADSVLRKLVEAYAMRAAIEHYQKQGWQVKDVSTLNAFGANPYDLLCQKSGGTLRVEVKGTLSDGQQVLVTIGEVNAARYGGVRTDLFVLHSITANSKADGQRELSGGKLRLVENWKPRGSELSPTQFSCKVTAG